MGMMTPEYVYITPHFTMRSLAVWEPWLQPNVKNPDSIIAAYRNVILVSDIEFMFIEWSSWSFKIQVDGAKSHAFKSFRAYVERLVVTRHITFSHLKYDPLLVH